MSSGGWESYRAGTMRRTVAIRKGGFEVIGYGAFAGSEGQS
jgi:hypothetical protein